MILREEIVVKRKSDMPFLDPEELKPKLKKIFETVVIPQIKKANMKKTAVEWIGKELESYGDSQFCKIEWEQLDSLIKQAKAMEKEQKEKEYEQGGKDAWDAFYEITQSE